MCLAKTLFLGKRGDGHVPCQKFILVGGEHLLASACQHIQLALAMPIAPSPHQKIVLHICLMAIIIKAQSATHHIIIIMQIAVCVCVVEKNSTKYRDGKSIMISFLPCLVAFWGFHPYMCLHVFFTIVSVVFKGRGRRG